MFGGHDDNAGGQQNGSDLQIPEGAFNDGDDSQAPPPPPPPPADDQAGDYIMTDPPSEPPAPDNSTESAQDTPAPDAPAAPATDTPAPANNDELLGLKQQALQQLSPLVGHLDQTPEEKFRTTMMMIQASDNAALLKDAFEAAQAIPDEKVKAQALLDVINEINYFTQHVAGSASTGEPQQ